MTYQIGQRIRRYKDLGTIVEFCTDASNGYIIQMDRDPPGAVIMAAGYLLDSAAQWSPESARQRVGGTFGS